MTNLQLLYDSEEFQTTPVVPPNHTETFFSEDIQFLGVILIITIYLLS